jgi:type IV pilus assembly protein PilY1
LKEAWEIKRKVFLLIFIILLAFTGQRSYSAGAKMAKYCYSPPTLEVVPNVLIVMDFSGSMQFPAYVPCNFGGYSGQVANCGTSIATSSSSWKYDPSKTYDGYFDPDGCYVYRGSSFQEKACDCSNRIGKSDCISGNLLNWITTTRIDIARLVLTGGRTSPSDPNTLESEGATYTIQDSNLKCEFKIEANTTTNRRLTISDYGGRCPLGNRDINRANIKITPSDPSSIRGIIHSFCGVLDLDLEDAEDDEDRADIREEYTLDLNERIMDACRPIMQLMVFGGDRKGEIKVGKANTVLDLINAINNEIPFGNEKPIGEALWEAYDYYKQRDDHPYATNNDYIGRRNAEKDPFYDDINGRNVAVPCREGFVLLISDGAWNGSVDPMVPAYTMATQDLRPDLPGKQNVYTYAVYVFGDAGTTTALQGRQAMITTAIFGGFDDKDGNDWPYPFTFTSRPSDSRNVVYPLPQCDPSGTWNSQCAEWDTAFNSPRDGLPYNFYEVVDVTILDDALTSALVDILRRGSSSISFATVVHRGFSRSTVAISTSRVSIPYLIVQPYYYPKYIRQDGREISWLGFLRSFWLDGMQNMREDSADSKVLNIAGNVIDKIFQFFFDPNYNEQKVAILQGSDTTTSCVMEGTKSINQLIPVFDAGCQLANRDPSTRTILYNKNGTLTPFTTSEASYFSNIWRVCSKDASVLCKNDKDCKKGKGRCVSANASCIIRYIRGENLSSDPSCPDYVKRTREVDIADLCPGSGGLRTWKLGDIVNSTPSVVSSEPVNIYHLRYNDTTYLQYIRTDAYKNRASFLFVGANDGMLHAFRIGRTVQTGDPDKPIRLVNAYNTMSNDLVGREEWAFIPRNALPYLVWYGNPKYCRVPTVDYRTAVFDVSINGPANANKTVSSWRTVLIGTMGFGGTSIKTSAGNFSSSVFALDLTDWLNGTSPQPKLLWEKELPDGTLTTSFPAVVRLGDPNKNGEWYVVIGSGPGDPTGRRFVKKARLYFINLRDGNIVRSIDIEAPKNKFAVGDIAVVDVDNDYQDDVIYFGVYQNARKRDIWGNFYRLSLRSGNSYKSVSALTKNDICTAVDLGTFATGRFTPPVFSALNFTKDENGNLWVFFGTGRYVMDRSDMTISHDNYLIGFKYQHWNSGTCPAPYTRAQLTDVTNQPITITITEVRQICMCDTNGCGMRNVVYNADGIVPPEPPRGWYYRLTGEAIYSQVLVIGGIVDVLTYVPPEDICQLEGSSNLISVYYKTGRPFPRPSVLSPDAVSGTIAVGQSVQLLQKISVGQGIPPIGNPLVPQPSQESQQLEKFVQTSIGGPRRISQQKATTSEEKFLIWIEK